MTITNNSIVSQQQQKESSYLTNGDKKKKKSRQPKSILCLPDVIELSLCGGSMTITRDTLLSLPESILIVMFPRGFITYENNICFVNFDHQALIYIIHQFQYPEREWCCNHNEEKATCHAVNPPLSKQGMIVLLEELEYFIVVIAEKSVLTNLKKECTQKMIKKDQIFDSLLESAVVKETSGLLTGAMNAKAEQDLINLLCQAGFTKQDRWGYRWAQPNKTCINSLSVLDIQYYNRLFIKQNLMMFWRKPAKKCWWSKYVTEINGEPVKLWCRRTWTLELQPKYQDHLNTR